MNIYATTSLLAAIFASILGFSVYLYGPGKTLNRMGGFFLFSIGWFSLFLTFLYLTQDRQQAILYAKVLNAGGYFMPSLLLHFSLVFVNRSGEKRKLMLLSYAGSLIFLSLVRTPLIIEGASKKFSNLYYYPDAGPLYPLFLIVFCLSWIYSEFLIFAEYKKCKDNVRRNQIKYLLFTLTAGFLSALSYVPLVMGVPILPIGGHFVFLCIGLVAYSIARHKLLDITIVIRKTLVYSILIGFITMIYLIGVFLAEKYFQSVFGYESMIATIITVSIIAIFFIPVKNKVQGIVDRLFFKGTLDSLVSEKERLEEEVRRSEKLKSVGTLAAGMAHEIKNPLTCIKTFVEFLPKKHTDPEFVSKFERIVVPEVIKINNIVKQLLDFAKPASLELRETNIQTLMDEILALLNNDFIKYRIKVFKDYTLPPIMKVDSTQIKQVFLNLILNAIDAMKETGGKLMLSITQSEKGVAISIEDTGSGIDPKHINHLFDPFYSTKGSGTGLGLSIVHGIIEKHSGRIEVESTPGKGTKFTMYLPA